MSWQDRATRRGYDDTLLRSQVMPSNRRSSSHVTSSHFYLLTCNVLTSWYFISKKNNWINWILIKTNIFDKSCISITSLIFILHLKYSILNQKKAFLHFYYEFTNSIYWHQSVFTQNHINIGFQRIWRKHI